MWLLFDLETEQGPYLIENEMALEMVGQRIAGVLPRIRLYGGSHRWQAKECAQAVEPCAQKTVGDEDAVQVRSPDMAMDCIGAIWMHCVVNDQVEKRRRILVKAARSPHVDLVALDGVARKTGQCLAAGPDPATRQA